ncbi:uncharacterized protein LOC127078899 [Lathyrus oleraceus]|uniref:uncharacterized protein LOC127078899 n=1 Tax=Pisum sativum TaxID=3888 RepID=UPI0021D24087|nr:uncharacterized protein LOC127078899 [Pisum sativum]
MEDVEASETYNIPRYVTTLSKSSMIITNRDNVDRNICLLISQVLHIEPKIGVVPDVSTSLAQPDNITETPLDNSDVNVSTLSPEKSKDKEESEGMSGDLADKDENSTKKDQSSVIVNIEDLDSDDMPIGQRLDPGITKRWSKVVTPVSMKKYLKRKEVLSESSESDHDVEHSVQDIVSTTRKLELKRELGKDVFECKEVMSLIQKVGLMKTVTGFGKCYEIFVKEFIVNISKECDNKRSKEFRKVNEEEQAEVEVFDNVICKEITVKQVKEWSKKGKLSASALSVKYDILHRTRAANWVPTNHTSNIASGLGKFIYILGTKLSFDFGSCVFDQTMKHMTSYDVKVSIAFPSLTCGVILSQHPSILISYDSIYKRDPPLSLHYRLFIGKHVPDIIMTSGQTSSRPTTRTTILADLKNTWKTLDETIKICTERKSRLEILIKALSEEEGGFER